MTVDELNRLDEPAARDALGACCAAPRWVARMVAARPFATGDAVLGAADAAWRSLGPDDWRAAIAHHPRIGEAAAPAGAATRAGAWSAREQSGARAADAATRAELEAGNAAYERRFGHPFIICATGKSAKEMLAAIESRLVNDATTELAVTAEELRRITVLRLEKLMAFDE